MKRSSRLTWRLLSEFISVSALLIAGCTNKASVTGPPAGAGSATVYPDSTQQIIRGFGAANIVSWRPDMTAGEIQTAFGTGSGQLGFTIMRLRISPDSTEFAVNIPSAKAAHSMGVTIIATPWTPPAWMKSTNNVVRGVLDTNLYAAYAAHLRSFADTMSSNGIPIYAISVQNEPDANVSYESCYWTADNFVRFMKNNAASVGVPVFMPESKNSNHTLSDPALSDAGAAENISFIGGHLYGTSPSRYPLATSLGKEVWMTEYLDLDTTWAANLGSAKSINDCMISQMSAYVWWYIVRYYGPIDENGVVTKRGYVMSQFARFVRPGFYRVSATVNPQSNVYLTAYKKGPQIVIVALNTGSSLVDQKFYIRNSTVVSFVTYVTSAGKNCSQESSVAVSGGTFTATLDPSSVTTLVSN